MPITLLHEQQLLILPQEIIHHSESVPEIFIDYLNSNDCMHSYITRTDMHITRVTTGHTQVTLCHKKMLRACVRARACVTILMDINIDNMLYVRNRPPPFPGKKLLPLLELQGPRLHQPAPLDSEKNGIVAPGFLPIAVSLICLK